MNPFTTDHPLTYDRNEFEGASRPWRGFFGNVMAFALVLCPLFYGSILFLAFTDEDQCMETPPFLNSGSDFFQGALVCFMAAIVVLIPIIAVYRLIRIYVWASRFQRVKGTR